MADYSVLYKRGNLDLIFRKQKKKIITVVSNLHWKKQEIITHPLPNLFIWFVRNLLFYYLFNLITFSGRLSFINLKVHQTSFFFYFINILLISVKLFISNYIMVNVCQTLFLNYLSCINQQKLYENIFCI